jgi:hypothetical protein
MAICRFKPTGKRIMSTDHKGRETAGNEDELLLAIATAMHLERAFPEGPQHLTLKNENGAESPWGFTGKLQRLTSRKNIHIRSSK